MLLKIWLDLGKTAMNDVNDEKRKRTEKQILEQNRDLAWLNQISLALNKSLDTGDILANVQQYLSEKIGVPGGTIYLRDDMTGLLEVKKSWHSDAIAGLTALAPHVKMRGGEKTAVVFSPIKVHGLPEQADGFAWGKLQIPLVAQTQLLGLLELIVNTRPDAIQKRTELFEMFGRELGMALYNAQLYDAELISRNLAETLRDASQALAQNLSLDAVLETLLDLFGKLVPYDSATIYFFENETHLVSRIERRAGTGQHAKANVGSQPISQDHPLIKAVVTGKHSQAVADTSVEQPEETPFGQPRMRSRAVVPIVDGEKVIAICGLAKREPDFYTGEHLRWLDALARQATVAIQNAWLFEQVRAGRAKLQSLTHRLVEVQEKERRYVAQELHDDAGQALTSLILDIGMLKQIAADPEAVKALAALLSEKADSVLENLHRLAMDLRPASLDHLGLVPALRQYSEITSSQCNINIQFEAIGLEKRLANDVEVTLYRIVQEALTNVIRHANATRVDVLLERQNERIIVMVEDNGVGFEPNLAPKPGRLGLVGMQERAEMLGGRLTIESVPSKGATILIEIPEIRSNGGK